MDGRAFLDVARELLSGTTEAHWRAAAGRAYYAALLEAKAALDRWGVVLPRRDPLHAAVRLRLTYVSDPDLQTVGKVLDDLVRLRNKADYDLASPGPFANPSATAGAVTRAPRDMTEPLLRISPHVDCTPEDLARLRQALRTLA